MDNYTESGLVVLELRFRYYVLQWPAQLPMSFGSLAEVPYSRDVKRGDLEPYLGSPHFSAVHLLKEERRRANTDVVFGTCFKAP